MQDNNTSVEGLGQYSLTKLKNEVFHIPFTSDEQVAEMFEELEQSTHGINTWLVHNSNFAGVYFANVISEVAAGVTHRRLIFDKSVYEGHQLSDDIIVNETFSKSYDVAFLEKSVGLLDLITIDCPSIENQQSQIKLIHELEFIKLIHEEIANAFLTIGQSYLDMVGCFVEAHSQVHECPTETALTRLSIIENYLTYLESMLYSRRDCLYRTIIVVRDLVKKYHKIKDKIARPYLRLVLKEANKRASTDSQLLDGFQNGSSGLLKAISCFSRIRVTSFSACAKSWIKQSILYHIKSDNNFIKLPPNIWQINTIIEQARSQISEEKSNEQSELTRISEITGLDESKLAEIQVIMKLSQVYSLDFDMNSDGKSNFSDILISTKEMDDFKQLSMSQDVTTLLNTLTEEQRNIILLTFGLMDNFKNQHLNKKHKLIETIRQLTA